MIPHGTDEWYAARLGKVTASRIADMLARTKSGWGASRANYMAELLIERLTGLPTDSYVSPAMQWGTDHEIDARTAYEFMRDCTVDPGGYLDHPRITMAGASPDGLIGADGMVEIKCPNSATHIETLQGASVPGKYINQIQWQLACTDRLWCDWVSFDPRMPAAMRLFVKRVERDEEAIKLLEKQVVDFLYELEAKVTDLVGRYMQREAA